MFEREHEQQQHPAPPPPLPPPLRLKRVTTDEISKAQKVTSQHAIHTPLIPLNYTRPDLPNLRIYLKLETLQPNIQSFKVRGASNAIMSSSSSEDNTLPIITASAGNMGRALASLCLSNRRKCIVILPDNAPKTKIDAIVNDYKAQVVHVSYDTWWYIIETSDCSCVPEIASLEQNYIFVHPVCDQKVLAGNATCGEEIINDTIGHHDVDAIIVPYGGGALSCGIGSAVLNRFEEGQEGAKAKEHDNSNDFYKKDMKRQYKCAVISCEPQTASPMATSRQVKSIKSFSSYYESSFCDGCGGKEVLKPMWELSNQVIDASVSVPIKAIEGGVWSMHEMNGIVVEGAGGIAVGVAMFAPPQHLSRMLREQRMEGDASLSHDVNANVHSWKNVVCVVSGMGIDRCKLLEILDEYDDVGSLRSAMEGLDWSPRGIGGIGEQQQEQANKSSLSLPETLHSRPHPDPAMKVMSHDEILHLLPMHKCIDAARTALISLSDGSGKMPLRSVNQLPYEEINDQPGYLVTMPSYYNGYAACKLISVYPFNNNITNEEQKYSSHQGVVALFNASNHGELLLLADAHTITSQRTAAASAVATIELANPNATVLSLLGTGEQARSHFISMLETGLSFDQVHVWGRDHEKTKDLARELKDMVFSYRWINWPCEKSNMNIILCETVQACVQDADVICTVTASSAPVLYGKWIKPGAHINAVGACLPTARELDETCIKESLLYCDSKVSCFAEAGEVVYAIEKGVITKEHLIGEIGEVLSGKINSKEGRKKKVADGSDGGSERFTVFESLGIALEDLTAMTVLYESTLGLKKVVSANEMGIRV